MRAVMLVLSADMQDVSQRLIRELREEIETLREQLAKAKTGQAGEMPSEKVAEMEEMISNLERAKQGVSCCA